MILFKDFLTRQTFGICMIGFLVLLGLGLNITSANAQSGGNGGTGSGDGCFVAGTKIIMADGTTRSIEFVEIGDMVKTVDTKTMEIENKPVQNLLTRFHSGEGDDFIVKIKFKNGNENQNTNSHPYYTEKKGWASYKPDLTLKNYGLEVGILEIGDIVYELVGDKLEKTEIIEIKEIHEPVETYNLSEVACNNNFFAGGMLVHNKASGNGTEGSCGNGESNSCFLPGTLIKMQDQTTKKIEDVRVGDQVIGYDIKNKKSTINIVRGLESPIRNDWYKVVLANGRIIKTTNEHPIFVKEYDDWASIDPVATWNDSKETIIAHQLEVGLSVMNDQEEYFEIVDIVHIPEKVQTYNLKEVSGNNTFFAEGALVHNKSSNSSGGLGFDWFFTGCWFDICEHIDNGGTVIWNGVATWEWTGWSACSKSCGGGISTRTRECSDECGSHEVETRACNTQACCTDSSWSPSRNSYCPGYTFTQTSNCGNTRSITGTKNCASSYCNASASPHLYCSGSTLMGVYSYWNSTGCSVSTCQGYWDYNSCGTFAAVDCGGDTCDTGGAEYEYCQDGNIWAKYDGTNQGCASAACYNNHVYCGHQEKEVCEVGKTCAIIGTDDAECVNKAVTWTEE